MTVEEQMLMNTLSKECERLHKELQVAEKHIDYLKEDKNQLYARCDKTARDDFLKGMYGSIRITSISEFVRLHKELQRREGEWEQGIDGTFLCSECGSGYTEQPTVMGNPLFEYCPCCGARMKGKKNDDTKNRCR